VILDFVKSEKNIPDPLTKSLSRSVVIVRDGVKPTIEFTDSGSNKPDWPVWSIDSGILYVVL